MMNKEEEIAKARSTISDPQYHCMAVYDEEFLCIFLYSDGPNQMPYCVWEQGKWFTLDDVDMYWQVKESLRRRAEIGCNDRIDGSNKERTL